MERVREALRVPARVPERFGDAARAVGSRPVVVPRPAHDHELHAAVRGRGRPVQARLRVGPVDDPLEREADRVAARVMQAAPLVAPHEACSCAGSSCVQRAERGPADGSGPAPADVEALTRTPGEDLPGGVRDPLEHRFGARFSGVRVHRDDAAARSARSIGARAYTTGHHIVFGEGEYAPHTDRGLHLLAHELAHVVQQADTSRSPDVVRRTPDDGAAADAGGAPRSPACCGRLTALGSCSTDPLACTVTTWADLVMGCLRSVPIPSGVTFRSDILDDARREVEFGVEDARATWQGVPRRRRTMATFLRLLAEVCRTRAIELDVEYRFNVVFENFRGQPQWGTSPPWADVVAALSALPPEHRSRRAGQNRPLRLERRFIDPSTRRLDVGGRMLSASEVGIYSPGVQSQPYARSQAIGIAGTSQTIRHEVGHTVQTLVPAAERDRFKEQIVGWIDYPWHWITHRPSPTCDPAATGLRREGCRLCQELRFGAQGTCDDTRLSTFLTQVATTPQTRNGRKYEKSDHFLASYPLVNVPQIPEFEYARTDFGEYFAEVYTFAVSVPEWLHTVLPRPQLDWLKARVFQTRSHVTTISRQLALGEPHLSEFLRRSRFLFTRRQLDALLLQVLTRVLARPGERAA